MAEITDSDRRAIALLKSKAKALEGTGEIVAGEGRVAMRAGDAFKEAAAILRDASENCRDLAVAAGSEEA